MSTKRGKRMKGKHNEHKNSFYCYKPTHTFMKQFQRNCSTRLKLTKN